MTMQTVGMQVKCIIAVVEKYMLRQDDTVDEFEKCGRASMTETVMNAVRSGCRLEMVLPAFPMKSPSPEKVLGPLPCRAEELVLHRLNRLVAEVCAVYEPGAILIIVSDGIVYGDLLGVSFGARLAYGDAVRAMARDLYGLEFCSIAELLKDRNISIKFTVEELLQHMPLGESVDTLIRTDINTLRTYRGFIKFLELDLASCHVRGRLGESRSAYKKRLSLIAREMILRGQCFSHLIAKSKPTALRLSIHAHDNSGPKFALRLFDSKQASAVTPWHNVACETEDGSVMIMHRHKALALGMKVVHDSEGRPMYMRTFAGIPNECKLLLLKPRGLLAERIAESTTIEEFCPKALGKLAMEFGVVVLRGFQSANMEKLRSIAHGIGTIRKWVFGDVLVVKNASQSSNTLNNVLTNEAMPMHFDGTFKLKTSPDGSVCPDTPLFQFFHCKKDSSSDGQTLFADTRKLLKLLPEELLDRIAGMNCKVFTASNNDFGGTEVTFKLVDIHPYTGETILRFHEPWSSDQTSHMPTEVKIDGLNQEESDMICKVLTELLYDERVLYRHSWQDNDFVISDNFDMMHTRTAFEDDLRELWRIHID